MSCSPITTLEFEEIKKLSAELSKSFHLLPNKQETLIRLPRGGIVIKTSAGNIQFGMPPETVKDSMLLGIEIPEIYVLPTNRFDFVSCLNVAEFEFPAYFNFFVRKKQVTLICSAEAKEAIITVFKETLLGPTNFDEIEEEFDLSSDKAAIPNFINEKKYFAKNPMTGDSLAIDHLIKFIIFDEKNNAKINDDLQVQLGDGAFKIVEKGKAVAIVPDNVEIEEFLPHQHPHSPSKEETKEKEKKKKTPQSIPSLEEIQDLQGGITPTAAVDISPVKFEPPSFGVTVLGHSHGFDPKGCTSGYIIWVNGRGVMVDPPPFSTQQLKRMGVPSRLIDSVIISHCHGDHDAAILQKALDSHKVELITTRTIMGSFVKKYAAIMNISHQRLKELFRFKPVIINAPLYINGAKFKFFYSFHSIPAIGFEVFYGEKSLYFSADTFYDPERLKQLVDQGIMTEQRCNSLIEGVWNHDLILHEAGVPPIHTPMKVLGSLPNDVKCKTLLVHVAAKDVPPDSGLRIAECGLEKTTVLDATPVDHFNLINILDIVCSIDLFKSVSIRTIKDAIIAADKVSYKAGETVVGEGELANNFFIILDGILRLFSAGRPEGGFDRYYQIGDFFGEGILAKGNKRIATAVAITDLKVLVISKSNFVFFFGEDKEVMTKMENFITIRQFNALRVMRKNSVFSSISSSQKLEFESILHNLKVNEGDFLWKKGETPEYALLVYRGVLEVIYDNADFEEDEDNTDEFSQGVFISESQAMFENTKCKMTVKAATDCHLFIVHKADYLRFLSNNPKLSMSLCLTSIVE